MSDVPPLWPTLVCRDPQTMISFLTDALGMTERATYRDGGAIVHAELTWTGPGGRLGGVMLGPVAGDCDRPPGGAAVHLVTDNADAGYAVAVAAGATIVLAPQDTPYGSRMFEVRDPEGNLWSVGTWHE